jgi:hypothetical protein
MRFRKSESRTHPTVDFAGYGVHFGLRDFVALVSDDLDGLVLIVFGNSGEDRVDGAESGDGLEPVFFLLVDRSCRRE